jgi:hypothetical protein
MTTHKMQFLKNRVEEYISILPLISLKSFKFPLETDYVFSVQSKLNKNEFVDNIEQHIKNFENAINRSLMSICGLGVFNFLSNNISCLIEIEDKAYLLNSKTNGFFNIKPLTENDLKLHFSKKSISNGLINVVFHENNEMVFHVKNKSYLIKYDFTISKKQPKTKIFDTYISGDKVNAIVESNLKMIDIKQSISSLLSDNKFVLTYILDRKSTLPFTFTFKFNENQKLLNKHNENCYILYEYEGFSIITKDNAIACDNKIEYIFNETNKPGIIVRELIEIEIFFNPNNCLKIQHQIMNQLFLKNKPLVKILSEKIIDDILLYQTSNEKIILNNIFIPENNIGIIIQVKNISENNEIAKITYANLEPKYILNEKFNEKSRCFGGIKLKPHEHALLLMQ